MSEAAVQQGVREDNEILCEIRNHVAFITLNRPSALNALTLQMLLDLRICLQRCANDVAVRAVLIHGAGDKAFCAGGDIRALYQSVKEAGTLHKDFFTAEYKLDYLLHRYPKPYVVLMDGITMGGGMGLAQGSKLRIVGDRTRIAMPEVGIGLFPDVGASFFLSRLPGSLGAYLALTGVQIRGADAVYCRLADVYLPSVAVAALAADLAALTFTDDTLADVRTLIHARAAHGLPAPSLSILRPAVDEHFSKGTVADILASLEVESRPEFADWAAQTAKLMRTRSPTMLVVALRQVRAGRDMNLADCFRMERTIVEQCFEHGDFIEGVRALIIDKDNSPKWQPSRIEDVLPANVDAFFRDRWSNAAHPLSDLETNP